MRVHPEQVALHNYRNSDFFFKQEKKDLSNKCNCQCIQPLKREYHIQNEWSFFISNYFFQFECYQHNWHNLPVKVWNFSKTGRLYLALVSLRQMGAAPSYIPEETGPPSGMNLY